MSIHFYFLGINLYFNLRLIKIIIKPLQIFGFIPIRRKKMYRTSWITDRWENVPWGRKYL